MKIFLDDERFPSSEFTLIARNFVEFNSAIVTSLIHQDAIEYISFDHDLGELLTGFDCAKRLVELDLDRRILSPSFSFVHSQNPIGKANIEGYLNNYLEWKESSK